MIYFSNFAAAGGVPALISVGAHSSNSLVANYPASISAGDFLLAAVVGNATLAHDYAGPAGFERITQVAFNPTLPTALALFYKVADGSESGTATFTASGGVGNAHTATIARVTGATSFEGLTANSTADSASTAISSPAVTTAGADRLIVNVYGNPTFASITEEAGWSEAFDYIFSGPGLADYGVALHYKAAGAAGVQDTEQPTPSAATPSIMLSLALSPSGSPASPSISVRGSRLTHVNNASSLNFSLPAGSQTGDCCVMFASHGWVPTTPTGWFQYDAKDGTNINGAVFQKILNADDIAAGTVTVSFNGTFYGHVGAVSFVGPTGGWRTWETTRNGSGATSRTVTTASSTPQTGDYAIYFGCTRGTATCSVNKGSSLQANAGSNASACIYGGSLGSSGAATADFAYSSAGSGDYQGIIVMRPSR